MTRKELQDLISQKKTTMPYYEKSIERDAFLFTWKSLDPDFKVPFMPEILLSIEGGLGWDLKNKKWVVGAPDGLFDEYLMDHGSCKASLDNDLELVNVVDEAAACAAHRVSRSDYYRVA